MEQVLLTRSPVFRNFMEQVLLTMSPVFGNFMERVLLTRSPVFGNLLEQVLLTRSPVFWNFLGTSSLKFGFWELHGNISFFWELHGNISFFGNFMGTFAITRELLEICCIELLRFLPSLWEEEDSGGGRGFGGVARGGEGGGA